MTETITIEKPKILTLHSQTWYVNEVFNNENILNIVENVLQNAIQRQWVQKR